MTSSDNQKDVSPEAQSSTQSEIQALRLEVETLKRIINTNSYSDLDVFTKQVQFKSKVGFWGKTPIAQPTATGATTVAEIVTILNNLGLTK